MTPGPKWINIRFVAEINNKQAGYPIKALHLGHTHLPISGKVDVSHLDERHKVMCPPQDILIMYYCQLIVTVVTNMKKNVFWFFFLENCSPHL